MGQRIAGIAYFYVDGTQYPLKGNFTVSPSNIERAGIPGQDYVHGFAENPKVPFIEGDVSLTQEVSIELLMTLTNSTVQADLANGKSYVLTGAWCTAALELNTKDGQTRVRFEGVDCDEVV
ncbi:phage tail tube protein [Chelatococcus reniformis]|uniref:Phage tail protein n=1 Tax=Chelatococcus reniformis TaxID=1494448 RepID=A0A916V0I1_9HYPH|nr:phage tail tube protein [Chelatococcus reniformis]GGC94590.1 phage tail protein [Chelatococcus reniformis]